jgi:CRP/FNR family cyclic AMP-dependent transcriptional regulator
MASPARSNDTAELNALSLIGDGESFKEELCQMLESAQIFSDFSRNEIQTLANYARAYAVEKGVTIFKEGHKGGFMCIVIEGRVDIFKESDTRENKRITTIRPGKTMGEMSILDELPYSASTIATEDTKIVMITKRNFDNMTEKFPELGLRVMRKIAKLLSLRLRQTTGILLDYLE